MTLAEVLLLKQPWLIQPAAFQAMAAASRLFPNGCSELTAGPNSPLLCVEDGIGIVALNGPMMRRPDVFSQILFGATDTEELLEALEEALERPDIEAVLLDIDSPGGSVTGTPELAQAVADTCKEKPVYAFSSGLMCSAAYWVASQAQAIYVTPSARVGSIGVVQPVVDQSEALRSQGIKVEVFSVGKFKGMCTPGVPLTEDQRLMIQSNIEEVARDFHAAVLSRGRKIPAEAMEGQDFSGKQAQKFNLAGVVRDRSEALRRLRSYHASSIKGCLRVDTKTFAMSKPIEDQLSEAVARVHALEADAQASAALLTEASASAEKFKQQIAAMSLERDQIGAELGSIRKALEAANAKALSLESREQDLEKRAALRAAEIVSSTGTSNPARITPDGDTGGHSPERQTPEERIAHYNDLIKRKQPKAAAEFYQKHIQTLFNA
jgi:signal peptide peptidase SppA